jgi:hypothetical protein
VGQAQAVLADERDQFFETLIVDVNSVTEDVSAATDALSQRVAFRTDRRHEHAQQLRDLERQAAEAQLAHEMASAKVLVLEQELAVAPEERKIELRPVLLEQRLAQQENEQRKRHFQALHRSMQK